MAFPGVVDLGYFATAPECVLDHILRAVLFDSVDEKLHALRHGCLSVGLGHTLQLVLLDGVAER